MRDDFTLKRDFNKSRDLEILDHVILMRFPQRFYRCITEQLLKFYKYGIL